MKKLLILALLIMPSFVYADYYNEIACSSTPVQVFTGEHCSNSVSKCFSHPAYSSARVTGCTSSNCTNSSYTWTEYKFTSTIGTGLGGCKEDGNMNNMPECYVSNSGASDYASRPYKCASGCYGTAQYTGMVTGCTKCPGNATCNGGNFSSFICNNGYYEISNQCAPCPDNATCSGGNICCNLTYYRKDDYCVGCPESPDGSPASSGRKVKGDTPNCATSITQCYLMANYPFTDSTGQYKFTDKCNYKE